MYEAKKQRHLNLFADMIFWLCLQEVHHGQDMCPGVGGGWEGPQSAISFKVVHQLRANDHQNVGFKVNL